METVVQGKVLILTQWIATYSCRCWVAITCNILSFIDFTSCVCVFFDILFLDTDRANQFFHVFPFAKRT